MELVKMCRACLLPEDKVHLIDWYRPIDSLEYIISYKECFCKCTQINLCLKDDPNEKDDIRTQYLCFFCAQRLKDAYEFIEKAKKADNELRCLRIGKNFEWVPVNIEDVDNKETAAVNKENCFDEICLTDIRHEPLTGHQELNITNNFDPEDVSNAQLKQELDEYPIDDELIEATLTGPKENDGILPAPMKSTCDNDTGLASSNESNKSSCSIPKSKKLKKKAVKGEKQPKTSIKHLAVMQEIVSCEICQKTMKRSTLKKHKQRHKPKIFLCQACPKTFSESNALKNHELTHEENRERYPCDKCNQTFVSRYSYKKHVVTHDNNRKPIFQCTQCHKAFLHKNGLMIHELHHKGATMECNICHKRYVRKIDLDTHLRTHSGEMPFACHICGKMFIHKRILNRHMQHHEGFFRYTCITCGEQFAKYDKYYTHRMQHTGLPYKCGICEKQFPDAYKTKRHIRGVHKINQDNEVDKLMVRVNDTKEYRGRIVEVLKNPEEEEPN